MTIELTAEQAQIVAQDPRGCTKVIAGPGTGKTTTLVQFYCKIVEETGADHHEILAVTFTNKAAAQMRALIGAELKARELPRLPTGALVGTFHSFCHRLLQEFGYLIGVPGGFRVLDTMESRLLRDTIARQLVFDEIPELELGPLLRALPLDDPRFFAEGCVSLISRIKTLGLTPEQFASRAENRCATFYDRLTSCADSADLRFGPIAGAMGLPPFEPRKGLEKLLQAQLPHGTDLRDWFDRHRGAEEAAIRVVATVYRRYEEELGRQSSLDFADLVKKSTELLEDCQSVADTLVRRHPFVLVDEFQDTNQIQLRLVQQLCPPIPCKYHEPGEHADCGGELPGGLFVVGDPKQSIYAFRHARPENLDDLVSCPERTFPLTINHRSRPKVIEVARRMIPHLTSDDDGQMLRAPLDAGPSPPYRDTLPALIKTYNATDFRGDDDRTAAAMEASWLAGQILDTLAEGQRAGTPVAFSDFAILLQARAKLGPIKQAFEALGIPYQKLGGFGFFDEPVTHDLVAYLRLMRDLEDPVALVRVLMRPPLLLTDRQLYLLAQALREPDGETSRGRRPPPPMTPALVLLAAPERRGELPPGTVDAFSSAAIERVRDLVALLFDGQRRRPTMGLSELYDWLLDRTGLDETLTDPIEARSYLFVSETIRNLCRRLEYANPRATLSDLIFTLERLQTSNAPDLPLAELPDENAVRIMTIHQSKGREFPYVAIPRLWHRSLRRQWAYDVRLGLIPGATIEGGAAPKWVVYGELGPAEVRAEFQRLLFVAVTRAMSRLLIGAEGKSISRIRPWIGGRYTAVTPRPTDALAAQAAELIAAQPAPVPVRVPAPAQATLGVVAAPEPITLSFSQLTALDGCPVRWTLERRLGFGRVHTPGEATDEVPAATPSEAFDDPRDARMGTLIHALIERHYKQSPQPDLATLVADGRAEVLTWTDQPDIPALQTQLQARLTAFAGCEEARLPREVCQPERAVRLSTGVDGHPIDIVGVVDLVATAPTPLLVDFKTGPASGDKANHYTLQLLLYRRCLAAEGLQIPDAGLRLLWLPPDGTASYLRPTEPLPTLEAALDARLAAFAHLRTRETLPAWDAARSDCAACPHRAWCPEFRP